MKRMTATRQHRHGRSGTRPRLHQLAAQTQRRLTVGDSAGVNRRDFLTAGAGVGMAAFGVPALLAACDGSDDSGPPPGNHLRTLFFNFSHVCTAAHFIQYCIYRVTHL